MVGAPSHGCPSNTLLNMKYVMGFPINPPTDSPKTKLKPNTIQRTATTAMQIKLCSIEETTFFFFTIPPSKNAKPGVIIKTKADEVNIQDTSAAFNAASCVTIGSFTKKSDIKTRKPIKKIGTLDFSPNKYIIISFLVIEYTNMIIIKLKYLI